jgi:hypothetical protein
MPHDQRWVDVYYRGSFVAEAHPRDQLSEEEHAEFMQARKESKKRGSNTRSTASRRQKARIAGCNGSEGSEGGTEVTVPTRADLSRQRRGSHARPSGKKPSVANPDRVNKPFEPGGEK